MKVFRDKLNSKISDATDISKPWDKDNQAWWDWYVGLADNNGKEDALITAKPMPNVTIPSDDEVISEMAETYTLTNDQIIFFRKNFGSFRIWIWSWGRHESMGCKIYGF